ncbi:membrane integrity-associated transporter subunit PqiC [Salinisphaera sp. LB1]|uniref:PqiC family protein n=1 Tax=Salinisphaera sp. LB1 TaxID=2183911 RepID=UPI000D708445|nr:ABC-type transport auxiliary lipoprotein family protein [Salinisphaera sp. LB1]AWN14642.1 putative lipoprotein [Salinisphaera sp. LB1]
MMLFRASLRRIFTAATLGVSLIALTGCATTQRSPSLFVLDAGASASDTTPQPGAPTLMIAPVTTASYLDQGGIVYQTGPHKVVIANNNRWASSLSRQLTDDLYATLNQRLAGVNVVPASGDQNGRFRLQTHVDQFLGHYDGAAHIAGRWTLVGPKGKILDGHAFEKTVPLAGDGYPALVDSLSRGWQDIARGMVRALTDKLASAPRP